jgi:sulfur carrier protein
MMNLIINGENNKFTDGISLEDIIKDLKIEDKVMACAVNMDIVKKENWNSFIPKEADKIELLQFVGGG